MSDSWRTWVVVLVCLWIIIILAGCMPLTPVRPCVAGVASYRDSFEMVLPSVGQIKADVWMQCGVLLTKEATK